MIRKIFVAIAAISLAALTTLGKFPERATAARAESTFALSQSKSDLDGLRGRLKEEGLKKKAPTPIPKPKSDLDGLRGRLKEEVPMKKEPTPTPKPRPDREEIIERLKEGGLKKRIVVQPKPTPTPRKL